MKNLFSVFSDWSWNLKLSGLKNKHAPAENRAEAISYFIIEAEAAFKDKNMEKLNKCISALLERFSFTISNSIKDIEEKETVKNALIELGDVVVQKVKDYIVTSSSIAYPIDVLIHIDGEPLALAFLDSILSTDDTLFDDKLVEKRIDVLKYFEGKTIATVLKKSILFINDSDDRLVIASLSFIRSYVFNKKESYDSILLALINKYVDADTSIRIRIEILNVIIEQGWDVMGHKKQMEQLMPNGYYITTQGYINKLDKAYSDVD